MKSLIIYYSFDGSTERIVSDYCRLNDDIDSIRLQCLDEKNREGLTKYIWGGYQVMSKKEPEIKVVEIDFNNYDIIVFGSPVWAGHYVPAFKTFFREYQLTSLKTAFFYLDEKGPGKITNYFRLSLSRCDIIGELQLSNVVKNYRQSLQRFTIWFQGLK